MTFAVNLAKRTSARTGVGLDAILTILRSTNIKTRQRRHAFFPFLADLLEEPKGKEGLPLCGFPFGSIDHLPAFLPELQLSLPSGLVRLQRSHC